MNRLTILRKWLVVGSFVIILDSISSLQLFSRRSKPKPPAASLTTTSATLLQPLNHSKVALDSADNDNIYGSVINLSNEMLEFNDDDNDEILVDDNHDSTICFEAPFRASSKPLAVPQKFSNLASLITGLTDFLSEPKHLSFGPSVSSSIIPATDLSDDLIDKWVTACRSVDACIPDPAIDRVVSIKTHGVSMPGLTVEWSALLGTKVIGVDVDSYKGIGLTDTIATESMTQSILPSLELVLIQDECQARGARPLVWTFQKLVGRSNRTNRRPQNDESGDERANAERQRRRETRFITRLAFSKHNDDSDLNVHDDHDRYHINLVCTGTMLMQFPIPRLLQKRLFRSADGKQKSEEKMGALISSQIEKDIYDSCLVAWEDNYRKYFEDEDYP